MSEKELAEYLGEGQAQEALRIVNEADFSKCATSPDMKAVYKFMVGSLVFLVNEKQAHNHRVPSESFFGSLSYKGVKSTGLVALVIAVAVAGLTVYGLVEYMKMQTRDMVAKALVIQTGVTTP